LTDNALLVYKYQLQYHQAVAGYMKALAEIEALTGRTSEL
jgi:hypothetical protein